MLQGLKVSFVGLAVVLEEFNEKILVYFKAGSKLIIEKKIIPSNLTANTHKTKLASKFPKTS